MGRYDWPAPPRGEDDPHGRARHVSVLRPLVDPTTIAPLKPKRRRRRPVAAPFGNAPVGNQSLWFPIGPSVMAHGQAGGNPNVAGRIRDIQVEPTDGLRIYAASAGGGAWFSSDRGETWVPLDDFQESDRTDVGNVANSLSCGAIYARFKGAADGSQDEVWVGTGEQALFGGGRPGGVGGLPGGSPAGVGFLHRDPSVGPGWSIVKGDAASADPDTLRGARFYRIAADPGNLDQLVAGTTKGLYLLTPGGAWTRVTSWPAAAGHPLDVVLTRLTGPDRVRIWVGVPSGVRVAEFAGTPATAIDPTALTFTAVALPKVAMNTAPTPGGTRVQLATDGTKVYVLGRRAIAAGESRATPPADLWSIDATGALATLSAAEITGMPPDLFMSAGDQSDYDMCIAAHPTTAGQVYVGGAAVGTDTGWNGAVYRCDIAGTTATPTLTGEGVHSDVHIIRVGPSAPAVPGQRTVWIGCDGGLFRSDVDGGAGTFSNRNDGLAVLQPGYVASHPTNPGIVAAGFQDNGTAVRIGDGLWEQRFAGDGGGVVFDPGSDNRYFRQYTQATWESSDGSATPPVHRRNARAQGKLKTSETIEGDSSLFYSGADAVSHGNDVHLAFGSDRVWYSRDWGRSWVTLPTATDPRAGDNPDLAQDVLETTGTPGTFSDKVGSTDSCASTYVGTAISGRGVIAVKFALPPDDAASNVLLRVLALWPSGLAWFTGTRASGATGSFAWASPGTFTPGTIRDPTPSETADVTAGNPLLFLPAPGRVSDVAVHDPARGALGSCYVTTTGGTIGGTAAALDTLWFFDGSDKWIPTGLRINHPNGTWGGTPPANIRVTAPALGVVVDPDDRKTVYVGTSVGVVKGTLTIGGTAAAPTYAWAWEQFVNGLPEAAVQDLSIRTYGAVKLLRVALQSRGVWEVDVANATASALTYLRLYPTDTRRVLPTPTAGPLLGGEHSPVPFDTSPDIVVDTTGNVRSVPPTESELLKIPLAGNPTGSVQVGINIRNPQIHVLVHQRWSDAAPPGQVRVALLRHDFPDRAAAVPIGALWTALVDAATSGTMPASLPDGWSAAAAALWQSPSGPVEPRLPRAVTFTPDFSAAPRESAFLLLAVVMSDSNQISAADLQLGAQQATSADQLVLSSPHVAAKSIGFG